MNIQLLYDEIFFELINEIMCLFWILEYSLHQKIELVINFKHGVGVNTTFGVCIRDDAEFWSFAPEHALAVLKEARVMFAHAQDVEHIERLLALQLLSWPS